SAGEWLINNCGERAYNNFFKPLLKSKFGKNLDEVSAAWLFGRIKFRSRRSLTGETLGYMDHGFQEFIEKLHSEIIKNGGRILTGTEVKKIDVEDGRVSGITTSDESIVTKNVISTIPPKELLKLCEFPAEFERKLRNIKYQRTICALFGLDEKLLDGVYWLNIKSETLPFGAIIEHTNFHNIPEYGGDHIVYAVSYVQHGKDELWRKSDEEVISTFVEGLREAFPKFRKSSIRWWKLAKGVYTAPIYKRGYLKDIGEIKSPIEGLHITGMFMMYPERSMNESLKSGLEAAKEVMRERRSR
ncbi:MAG: FAD-dependent oxidoreductase, partial [Candidatus Hydrothermarchaeales archaeon]